MNKILLKTVIGICMFVIPSTSHSASLVIGETTYKPVYQTFAGEKLFQYWSKDDWSKDGRTFESDRLSISGLNRHLEEIYLSENQSEILKEITRLIIAQEGYNSEDNKDFHFIDRINYEFMSNPRRNIKKGGVFQNNGVIKDILYSNYNDISGLHAMTEHMFDHGHFGNFNPCVTYTPRYFIDKITKKSVTSKPKFFSGGLYSLSFLTTPKIHDRCIKQVIQDKSIGRSAYKEGFAVDPMDYTRIEIDKKNQPCLRDAAYQLVNKILTSNNIKDVTHPIISDNPQNPEEQSISFSFKFCDKNKIDGISRKQSKTKEPCFGLASKFDEDGNVVAFIDENTKKIEKWDVLSNYVTLHVGVLKGRIYCINMFPVSNSFAPNRIIQQNAIIK